MSARHALASRIPPLSLHPAFIASDLKDSPPPSIHAPIAACMQSMHPGLHAHSWHPLLSSLADGVSTHASPSPLLSCMFPPASSLRRRRSAGGATDHVQVQPLPHRAQGRIGARSPSPGGATEIENETGGSDRTMLSLTLALAMMEACPIMKIRPHLTHAQRDPIMGNAL